MIKFNANDSVKNVSTILQDVKNEFFRAAEGPGNVVFDFGTLRRIDLSLAQIIVASVRKAGRDGIRIGIRSANDDVKRQLYICGLKL